MEKVHPFRCIEGGYFIRRVVLKKGRVWRRVCVRFFPSGQERLDVLGTEEGRYVPELDSFAGNVAHDMICVLTETS